MKSSARLKTLAAHLCFKNKRSQLSTLTKWFGWGMGIGNPAVADYPTLESCSLMTAEPDEVEDWSMTGHQVDHQVGELRSPARSWQRRFGRHAKVTFDFRRRPLKQPPNRYARIPAT